MRYLWLVLLAGCGGVTIVSPPDTTDASTAIWDGSPDSPNSIDATREAMADVQDTGSICNGDQPGPTLTGKPCPIGHAPVCGGGGWFTCEGLGSTGAWKAWPVPLDGGPCDLCP